MKDKKVLIRLIIFVLLMLVLAGSVTFAFLAGHGDSGALVDVSATSNSTDNLRFVIPKDINIYASQRNFGPSMGSVEDSVTASAIFTANNYSNFGDAVYSLTVNITNNGIDYSEANINEDPELILVVTNDFGATINIPNFTPEEITYKNSSGNNVTETAYNITGYTGSIPIVVYQGISSTSTTTQNWTIKMVLVNYDFDQTDNQSSNVMATITISENNYCENNINSLQCKYDLNYYPGKTNTIAFSNGYLYHHDGNIRSDEYVLSERSINQGYVDIYGDDHRLIYFYDGVQPSSLNYGLSYRYSDCQNYADSCGWHTRAGIYLLKDYPDSSTAYNAAMENLRDEGYLEFQRLDSNDGSWRFSGLNPSNYICFGSDAVTCPAENLYRIIGLIPVDVVTNSTTTPVTTERQTLYKIIKNDYATSAEIALTFNSSIDKHSLYYGPSGNQPRENVYGFYWSGSSGNDSNTWSSSTLNTTGLNTNFISSFTSIWKNKIAKVMWKVGGGDTSYIMTRPMSAVYRNEITESGQHANFSPTDGNNEYAAKIGLMYISDYGYAAPSTAWDTDIGSSTYSFSNSNKSYKSGWLYRGVNEWFITRVSDRQDSNYYINYSKYIDKTRPSGYEFGVRPTFYLTEDTEIDFANHDGTTLDPYRIVIN